MKSLRFLSQYWDFLLVFIFSWILMNLFTINFIPADQYLHAQCAKQMLEEDRLFSGNFLMYFCVNCLSGMTGNLIGIISSLVLLLTCAITMKYYLTKRYLSSYQIAEHRKILYSLLMMVIYVIPIVSFIKTLFGSGGVVAYYYGYLVPTLWHNSTIILSLPFCIIIYFKSIELLNAPNKTLIFEASLLTIINVFIKPSFFFTFAIAYPIILLFRFRVSKVLLKLMIPIFVGAIAVLFQYISIYQQGPQDGSGVCISLVQLLSYDYWINNGIYIICSLIFPLLFFVFFYKEEHQSTEYWYVLLLLVVSLLVYLCIHESGPRANDGNFYWQIVPSFWLFFFYVLRCIINRFDSKSRITTYVFYLHALCGIVYISHMLFFQTYW